MIYTIIIVIFSKKYVKYIIYQNTNVTYFTRK